MQLTEYAAPALTVSAPLTRQPSTGSSTNCNHGPQRQSSGPPGEHKKARPPKERCAATVGKTIFSAGLGVTRRSRLPRRRPPNDAPYGSAFDLRRFVFGYPPEQKQ